MNTDPATVRCPKCDGTIPADAPQGLCPRCVLAGAASATDPGIRSRTGLAAPPLEAVAAAFPQFEILGLVGLGGMGVVYKVRQPKLDRIVALKLLPMSLSADPAFAERFHREARFLARLSHPQIVSVYDFGESGGFCYLLMEFVDGVNLRQAMRAGRFTPDQALAVVPDICAALQYAHDQGVLHRDIKPENILLDAQGRVKIADFGIAKLVGDPGDPRTDLTLTQSGARLGTPHYMAPEQIEKPSDVDHRADIYSLGVVFYELLTGELPLGRFAAPSAKTPLDTRVDAIVMRALAKERELRQQSAGEVKTEVEGLRTKAEPAPPMISPQRTPTPAGPIPPLPTGAHWMAWLFLSLGGAGFILSLSGLALWGTGWPFALNGIALLTRSAVCRKVALAVNAFFLVLGLYSFFVTPLVLVSGAKTIGPSPTFSQMLWGQLTIVGCAAATWILCHRAVRPAFSIGARPPGEVKTEVEGLGSKDGPARGAEATNSIAEIELVAARRRALAPGVTGEVAGRVQFFGEMSGQIELSAGRPTQLAEAILSLGKTSESADLRKVKVQRADGTTVVVDVRKVIQENRRDLDLDLRDGDRVEVPKRIL